MGNKLWESDEYWDDILPLKYFQQVEPLVRTVRAEIFRLAKQAPDMETLHWYTALDECFENDSFSPEDFKSVQWRAWVLGQKGEPVIPLQHMITPILQLACLVDGEGKPLTEKEEP